MSGPLFDDRDLHILNNLISSTNQVSEHCSPSSDMCTSGWSPMLVHDSHPAPIVHGNPELGYLERLPTAPQQRPPQCTRQSHQALTRTIQHKKPKRIRIAFTTDQLLALENEFSVRNYVTPAQRALIARNLKVNEKHVKTWFQNRRMRQKKMHGSDSSSIISDNEFGVSSTISDLQHTKHDGEIYQHNISPTYLIPDTNSQYATPQNQPESFPNSCCWQNQWCNDPIYTGYENCLIGESATPSSMQVPVVTSSKNDPFSSYESELAQYLNL